MNWLDITILVVIAIFFFAGFKNGILRTLISLAGLVLGIILAGRLYPSLSAYLTFIPTESVANIVAFIIILVVVLIMAAVIAFVMTQFAKAILLGWLNGLLGGLFGALMGFLITSALLAMWVKFRGPSPTVEDSQFAKAFLDYFPVVLGLLPEDFSSIRDFFR